MENVSRRRDRLALSLVLLFSPFCILFLQFNSTEKNTTFGLTALSYSCQHGGSFTRTLNRGSHNYQARQMIGIHYTFH